MKRVPLFYKTEELKQNLRLSTRVDKLGNVFHVVEYFDSDDKPNYSFFVHLSSALDFIHSNFN